MTTSPREEGKYCQCEKIILVNIGFEECPDCELPYAPAPRVEEEKLREDFDRAFPISIDYPEPPPQHHTETGWNIEVANRRNRAIVKQEAMKDWWLEKVAQARQEEQDQIEARMKEWVEKQKDHRLVGVIDPHMSSWKGQDIGYDEALSNLLAILPAIIRNTPEV